MTGGLLPCARSMSEQMTIEAVMNTHLVQSRLQHPLGILMKRRGESRRPRREQERHATPSRTPTPLSKEATMRRSSRRSLDFSHPRPKNDGEARRQNRNQINKYVGIDKIKFCSQALGV